MANFTFYVVHHNRKASEGRGEGGSGELGCEARPPAPCAASSGAPRLTGLGAPAGGGGQAVRDRWPGPRTSRETAPRQGMVLMGGFGS